MDSSKLISQQISKPKSRVIRDFDPVWLMKPANDNYEQYSLPLEYMNDNEPGS